MSYDISLCDPVTQEPIELDQPHELKGGTYALGGTTEAWLNITYNYSEILHRVLDPSQGIRSVYNMTGAESIPKLESAIAQLGDDTDSDYWKPTEGNVKCALLNLVSLAKLRPDGVWNGD